ncbi:MAG: TspO/MBR family protein [archaeon]
MNVDYKKLVLSLAVCQLAGIIGSFFTTPNIGTWYAALAKPSFNPPNWIFAPVWTTLFVLMGVSLYLIWVKGFEKHEVKQGVSIFAAQLVLNVLWSIFFFGLQNPLLALAEIFLLWIAIFATIWIFYKVDKRVAYLLIPYIAWVSFAALLNYSIWALN